jgi:hypothetical protein
MDAWLTGTQGACCTFDREGFQEANTSKRGSDKGLHGRSEMFRLQ